jgi:carboxyl-terminal processing protease
LPPVRNTDFKQELAGQFEGIGAELGMKDKQLIVVAPLDGSPAQKAGLKAGDAILKVNNQPTFSWTLGQAVEKIRGPKGSDVTLEVLQKDQPSTKTIKIVRDTITVKSVVGWVKKVKDVDALGSDFKKQNGEKKVAYIRLSQFGDNTNNEWVSVVDSLQNQIKQDSTVSGIVLDLRNNPGGYLTEAEFIASEFIKSGVVVYQDNGIDKKPYPVNRVGNLLDTPLVVLINKGSASASEIVAGALRDHNRAKLIGEQSFGKGTIQTAEDLGNGAGLHITIAKWLTPNETWVHGKGLTPDISVEVDTKDQARDAQLEKAIEELVK